MDLRLLVEQVTRGFGSLGGNSADAGRIWDETRGWVGRFMTSAMARWLPFYAKGKACGVHEMRSGVQFPCAGTAVLPCGACGTPACLSHAQVDQHGDGTCYHCIVHVITAKRAERMARESAAAGGEQQAAPPPVDMSKEIIKRALGVLGLKPGASWDEVRAAHREKAAALHPDRAKTEAARKRLEEKSKLVNSAFADLKRLYKTEKAA